MTHRAEDFATRFPDTVGSAFLEVVPERVVRCQEKPLLSALRDDGFGKSAAVGVSIVGPMHGIGCALFASQKRRTSARSHEHLVLLRSHVRDRERYRRVRK